MIIYFLLDENNRLQGWSDHRNVENEIELRVPDEHEVLRNPFIYRFENGSLIRDEAYLNELMENARKEQAKLTTEQRVGGLELQNAKLLMQSADKEKQIGFLQMQSANMIMQSADKDKKLATLGFQNANMIMESAQKDMKIKQLEQQNALILLQLAMK